MLSENETFMNKIYRYFLECSYLGTEYAGWQIQNNAKTIQGIIEEKMSTILRFPVSIYGSSRTDAGVHASHQVAHFDIEGGIANLDFFKHKLNCILPKNISILKIYNVSQSAHARFDAKSRKYTYNIVNQRDPFSEHVSFCFPVKLNIELMSEACDLLVKKNLDCEIFSKKHTDVKTFFCDIYIANWSESDNKLIFCIEANRFLRGMVRIIVGYMIAIGRESIDLKIFKRVVENKLVYSHRPALVPAKGLTLACVKY